MDTACGVKVGIIFKAANAAFDPLCRGGAETEEVERVRYAGGRGTLGPEEAGDDQGQADATTARDRCIQVGIEHTIDLFIDIYGGHGISCRCKTMERV
jgi:hypothetical protein